MGDKSKKDNDNKSEDKDNNTAGTTGAHVGEVTSDKDKTVAPSNSSSIGVHISDVTKTIVRPTQCVQDILAAHSIDNPIWNCTDTCDISIETSNNTEAMAGAHVANQEYQD